MSEKLDIEPATPGLVVVAPSPPPGSARSVSSGSSTVGDGRPHDTSLREDLKERHVNMIAFSTCVGIGMYLQSGKVIYLAGPGLATIAYILAGSVMWCSISSLGEMTALFPVRGPIFVFPHRFVDEGVGYAVGWMAWFSWVVIIAAEVLAVAQLFNFHFKEEYLKNIGYPDSSLGWQVGQTTNPGIWVFLFLILVFAINCLPVLWYGRLEYIFGCVKMFFIVGLILFNVVINARQRVPHASGRFWAYDYPFSFRSQNITLRGGLQGHDKVISGSTGTFLAVWTAITTVIFSMIGFESVPITAAECKDLSKNETVKMATRKISLRIVILYTLGTLVVGFNVPYTDPNLRDNAVNSIRGGQNSAFMLAAVRDHIRGWPHFFNAFFIFSATTSGVNSLYLSSRILHALAETADAWPDNYYVEELRVRLNRTTFGVPHAAVFTSWLFGLLAFLATKPYPAVELGRMATNSVVSMLIVYAIICFSYLQFFKCIGDAAAGRDVKINSRMTHNYDRNRGRYPFRSRGQRFKAVYGLVGCSLLAFFNGWRAFVTPFSMPDFIASYISVAIFVVIVMAYHVKFEGWNPRNWRRRISRELKCPTPVRVDRGRRVGEFRLANPERVISRENAEALGKWAWAWIK